MYVIDGAPDFWHNFVAILNFFLLGYYRNNITAIQVAHSIGLVPAVVLKLSAIHLATIFFLCGLLLATVLLGAQYLFRYRKYHIARAEDQDSLTDPHGKYLFLFQSINNGSDKLNNLIFWVANVHNNTCSFVWII